MTELQPLANAPGVIFQLTICLYIAILGLMIYVGLDISSGAGSDTGICILDIKNKTAHLHAVRRKTKKSAAFQLDTHPYEFLEQLQDIFSQHNLSQKDCIYIAEEYRPGANKRAGWVICWIQGFISSSIHTFSGQRLPFVNQSIWKRELIRRATKGKEFIEDSVLDRCDEMGIKLILDMSKDDRAYQDALDAFGIAYYGFRRLSS